MTHAFVRTLSALATAASSVVAWIAWLGFHSSHDVDPVTGDVSGPYEAWQVVGLSLTLIAAVYLAARWGRPVAAVIGGVLGLGLVATIDWAASPDGDGLWPIGVVLLMLAATAVGVFLALLARRAPRHHPAAG